MKYVIGQAVYTSKDIRGWFDFSMKNIMPAKTLGHITKIDKTSPDRYYVFFGKEFGEMILPEDYLELG